ncbi:MAG: hypothetical protein KGL39_57055 [Patescibacteria group bacterium]|nr:hypothetical protein [Patescibacteria group bacterium]
MRPSPSIKSNCRLGGSIQRLYYGAVRYPVPPPLETPVETRRRHLKNGKALEGHARSAHGDAGPQADCPACQELRRKMEKMNV